MSNELLKQMVDKLGLKEVARQIGYNKSAVCHVLKGSYRGSPERILAEVEKKYSQQPVECPVLGEIPLCRCVGERSRPFAATNPLRVALFRACPGCRKGREA